MAIGDTFHTFETGVLDAPCLSIPSIAGLTLPANLAIDSGVAGTCIYLHLTSLQGPTTDALSQISGLPIINTNTGFTYGGSAAGYGQTTLPKLVMEGHIDTPCISFGEYFLPQPVDTNNIRYTYAEIIAMMLEGRANFSATTGWARLDPIFFRDSYGRVYLSPRILDFSAQFVEGVPERTQFTMTLKV